MSPTTNTKAMFLYQISELPWKIINFLKKKNKSTSQIILATLNFEETQVVKWLPKNTLWQQSWHSALGFCLQGALLTIEDMEPGQEPQLTGSSATTHLPKTQSTSIKTVRSAKIQELWGQHPKKLLTEWLWRKRKGKMWSGGEHQGGRHDQKSISDTLGVRWLLDASTDTGRHRDRIQGSEAQKEVWTTDRSTSHWDTDDT